jgi:hypothetical protein
MTTSIMVLTLDLAPAVTLHRHLAKGAFVTGLMIYLEGLVALVLLTERAISPIVLVPIAIVMAVQFALIRRPLQLLASGRLARSYTRLLLGGAVYVLLVAIGARPGDDRMAAVLVASLVVAATGWPAIRVMTATAAAERQLRSMTDYRVLTDCMSFSPLAQAAIRLRSFGGHRGRWAMPFALAALAFGASAILLAAVLTALGVTVNAAVAQVSAIVGLWTFYRAVRYAKPRASALKQRDARPPVLILREFRDDALATPGSRLGRTFEYFFAGELDRIGPAISVGKPGERLAPLGASRDYLGDPDWQSAVARLIDEAGLVVFLLGNSDSVEWELRTVVNARGNEGLLIVVPPLTDRAEIARRWARFADATRDLPSARLPREIPGGLVRAVLFAGMDVVLMLGVEPARRTSWYARASLDYRMALRLFGCLLRERPASAAEVQEFVRMHLPFVHVSEGGDRR